MANFQDILSQGPNAAWFYLPTAILLGALHGLEPGHSKTVMAGFIIATRGTIPQALLLGLCATFSHSLLIWILAACALHYGGHFSAELTEPYFQIGSAALIFAVAGWMAWKTRREVRAEAGISEHCHTHGEGDNHAPAPGGDYQDAHELMHAREIETRFADRPVTTTQIALFGLSGGLLPCPAAFTIVLACLQLKRFALGISMVLAFSVGLAATLVATGVLAAWSLRHAAKRFRGLGKVARKLPYLSSALLMTLALVIGFEGLRTLVRR